MSFSNPASGAVLKVHGDVINVAGEITLNDCDVVGHLRSSHGSIDVNASDIEGGILVKRKGCSNQEWIKITIGPGSTVFSIDARQAFELAARRQ